jgi:nicotinate-nucleotide pyrophosphorylase (carboxylating)
VVQAIAQQDLAAVRRLIELARVEDLGTAGDITTRIAGIARRGRSRIIAREPCIVAGMAIVPEILRAFGEERAALRDGAVTDGAAIVEGGVVLGELEGDTAVMLAAERTLLNFLQRLSGVATLTRRYVDAVAGTAARIYDTRKTLPGWRVLDKYAVRCGGGVNHRTGLHDAILIKDNHLAGVSSERIAPTVFEMLNQAAGLQPPPAFIEVEVDAPEQFAALLDVVGIDVILLDNFSTRQLREAVTLRDGRGLRGRLALEASGGVNLQRVREIAATGVERVSVGALTHSAPAVDIALEFDA